MDIHQARLWAYVFAGKPNSTSLTCCSDMEGNLDRPPLTISGSRVKRAGLLMILLVSVVVGFWPSSRPPPPMAFIGLVVMALMCPVAAWATLRPDRLTLSPKGLAWRSLLKTTIYEWKNLSEFYLSSVNGVAVIRFKNDDGRPQPSTMAKIILGDPSTGQLPSLWKIPTADVVAALNQARSRWSTHNLGKAQS